MVVSSPGRFSRFDDFECPQAKPVSLTKPPFTPCRAHKAKLTQTIRDTMCNSVSPQTTCDTHDQASRRSHSERDPLGRAR
eukprot:2313751-Prymnesium_polylepis.1